MFNNSDLETTDYGDFIVDENGDLKLATPLRTRTQNIIFRCLTARGDFLPEPELGAGIQNMYGEQNTRENAKLLQRNIVDALTEDGYFLKAQVVVEVIPIDYDRVRIIVATENDTGYSSDEAIFLSLEFKYDSGDITLLDGTEG